MDLHPGMQVALACQRTSSIRYRKATVVQVYANGSVLLDDRRTYDVEGYPLRRDGTRKQLSPDAGTIEPLTPFLAELIERQDIGENLRQIPWVDMPLDMLRKVRAVASEYLPQYFPPEEPR